MNGSRFGKWMAGCYVALVISVIIFLIYIAFTEGVVIKRLRPVGSVEIYEGIVPEIINDADAPVGIRRIYRIPLANIPREAASLAFYSVHEDVKVSISGKLIYSLEYDRNNKFMHTTGGEWNIVPLRYNDKGKEIEVEITPDYRSSIDRDEIFYVGARLQIYQERLFRDLPQLFLCLLTVICGIFLIFVSLRNYYKGNGDTANGYLGMFAIVLGVWKITDTRSTPLMLSGNPMLLSTISIAFLSLGSFPLLNFMRKQVRLKHFPVLEVTSVIAVVMSAVTFLLQLFHISDYRESLSIIHVCMGLSIVAIIIGGIRAWSLEKDDPKVRMAILCFLLCAAGGVVDIVIFYLKSTSSGIMFTLFAFLVYVVYSTISSNLDLTKRANRDMFTGLYNRSRCNELLRDEKKLPAGVVSGFAMFDLNDLKLTNDTMGHEAGDRMIQGFVSILKSESLPGTFLGRYGGDEFVAYVKDVDDATMKRMMDRIATGVQVHNAGMGSPEISYSAGWALSSEVGDQTMMGLFKLADERMYLEKKKYHELHDRRGKRN